MVDLVQLLAPGETEFEQALWIASRRGDASYITRLLRNPDFDFDWYNRVLLAQFIEGDYQLGPGRRGKDDRITAIEDLPTRAQMASQAVRDEMRARRERGDPIKGARQILIDRFAAEFGADPVTVANHVKNGR